MATIEDVIEKFRREPEGKGPLSLMSSDGGRALPGEIEKYWPGLPSSSEAVALWTVCRRAHLFENTDGRRAPCLVLFDPRTSAHTTAREKARRAASFRDDDMVIGDFIGGDAELVVLSPSESGERRILLAPEDVDRRSWREAGRGVLEFLDAYFQSGGYRKRGPRKR
jgi:hypothetical protein